MPLETLVVDRLKNSDKKRFIGKHKVLLCLLSREKNGLILAPFIDGVPR